MLHPRNKHVVLIEIILHRCSGKLARNVKKSKAHPRPSINARKSKEKLAVGSVDLFPDGQMQLVLALQDLSRPDWECRFLLLFDNFADRLFKPFDPQKQSSRKHILLCNIRLKLD